MRFIAPALAAFAVACAALPSTAAAAIEALSTHANLVTGGDAAG